MDYDALERLAKLRDQGALSNEEFAEQKKILLENGALIASQNLTFSDRTVSNRPLFAGIVLGSFLLSLIVFVLVFNGGAIFSSLTEIDTGSTKLGALAERRFELLQQSGGSSQELCTEAEAVANAYLDDGNAGESASWRATRDKYCRGAEAVKDLERSFNDLERSTDRFIRGY